MASVTLPPSVYTPPQACKITMMNVPANILSLPPRVIERICETLHEEQTRCSMQALVSFSRTCWAINWLAQGVLWRILPSIAPLLCTLPADLCSFSSQVTPADGTVVPSCIEFLRNPYHKDLDRFRMYAALVQEIRADLTWWPFAPVRVAPGVWSALRARGPKPLCPNLRVLQHVQELDSDTKLSPVSDNPIFMLLGPSLTSVAVDISSTLAQSLLRAISRTCPDLDSLSVRITSGQACSNPPVRALQGRSDAMHAPARRCNVYSCNLWGLIDLTVVKLVGIYVAPDALSYLGNLPHIRILEFDVHCDDLLWDAPHEKHDKRFSSLESLKVRTNRFEWCTVFLETITSCRLQVLSLVCLERPAPFIVMRGLCEAVGAGPWREKLHTLEIISGRAEDRRYRIQGYPPVDFMGPLLTLPALRRFALYGRCKVMYGDATLEAMKDAWPGIEHLDLRNPLEDHRIEDQVRRESDMTASTQKARLNEQCERQNTPSMISL
ncbi:hypothetical protein PYCCODRAFT_1475688 [Trametes coccinea BRFM310]|uniref:F-box domain-containing protein n=1 Tax=Trametes coccinea (strain BRFM310) TaxID=1353009 RepID=A0A1Y2IVG5_TRAC3|nr:hypothetical protein PYCCODRAFT_1475688 [Trametes coccinea BRFM310]